MLNMWIKFWPENMLNRSFVSKMLGRHGNHITLMVRVIVISMDWFKGKFTGKPHIQ